MASAVAAVGLSSRPALVAHSVSSATRPFEVTLLVTLVLSAAVVLAGLFSLLAASVPRRRGRDADQPHELIRAPSSRLTTAAAAAVGLTVVAFVVWVTPLAARSLSSGSGPVTTSRPGAGPTSSAVGPTATPTSGSGTTALWGLGVAVLLLGLLVLGGRARDRRAHRGPEPAGTGAGEEGRAEQRVAAVRDAEVALASGGSPRVAVISSYLAMERTLAAQGRPREPVVTPGEFVAVTAAEHPSVASSATRLTEVFERARFSGQAIGSDDVDEAGQALAELRRALGGG